MRGSSIKVCGETSLSMSGNENVLGMWSRGRGGRQGTLSDAMTKSKFLMYGCQMGGGNSQPAQPRESTGALALAHLPLILLPFHNLKEPED